MVKVYQALKEVKTVGYGRYYNLTPMVEEEVEKSGIKNGFLLVSVLHTTAAVTLQEADSTVHSDGKAILDSIAPAHLDYEHIYEGRINAAAHHKQMLIGNSRIIPVKNQSLVLGTWQKLFLIELFQAMKREVFITVIGV